MLWLFIYLLLLLLQNCTYNNSFSRSRLIDFELCLVNCYGLQYFMMRIQVYSNLGLLYQEDRRYGCQTMLADTIKCHFRCRFQKCFLILKWKRVPDEVLLVLTQRYKMKERVKTEHNLGTQAVYRHLYISVVLETWNKTCPAIVTAIRFKNKKYIF